MNGSRKAECGSCFIGSSAQRFLQLLPGFFEGSRVFKRREPEWFATGDGDSPIWHRISSFIPLMAFKNGGAASRADRDERHSGRRCECDRTNPRKEWRTAAIGRNQGRAVAPRFARDLHQSFPATVLRVAADDLKAQPPAEKCDTIASPVAGDHEFHRHRRPPRVERNQKGRSASMPDSEHGPRRKIGPPATSYGHDFRRRANRASIPVQHERQNPDDDPMERGEITPDELDDRIGQPRDTVPSDLVKDGGGSRPRAPAQCA